MVERPEVKVYDKNGSIVDLKFRGEEVKKGGEYQCNRKLRQDSRSRYANGLARQAWHMKVVTNDDVKITINSKEKNTKIAKL